MNNDLSGPARTIAIGMVASSLVFLLAANIFSKRLGTSLEQAGRNAQSSFSAPSSSFPSYLQIEMLESEKTEFEPGARERLMDSFIKEATSRTDEKGRTIRAVELSSLHARLGGKKIGALGTLHYDPPAESIEFFATLDLDPFGDFGGTIKESGTHDVILKHVHISR